MSNKTRLTALLTLALAFLAFAAIASAQDKSTTTQPDNTQKQERRGHRDWGKRGDGEGFRGMRSGGMWELQGLNLTDAQKAQIKSIHETNRPDEATMQQMKTLMEAKRGGTITPEQTEQLKTLRTQQRDKMESVHQQVLAILTPEQRQQLDQKRDEMKKRREERRQQRQQNAPQTDKPTTN